MVTIGKEPHDEPIKMKAGHSTIWGVTFAANGEYLVHHKNCKKRIGPYM